MPKRVERLWESCEKTNISIIGFALTLQILNSGMVYNHARAPCFVKFVARFRLETTLEKIAQRNQECCHNHYTKNQAFHQPVGQSWIV